MLNEIMKDLVEEFDSMQDALVNAIGGNLKSIVADMAKNRVPFHGNPPFILDNGETPLLLVDGAGRFSRLPPSFSLSEEATQSEFDVIYTLPVLGFGLVRFIPASADFEFPASYKSKFVASAYDADFLRGLEQYLDAMKDAAGQLAAFGLSKKLLQLQSVMEEGAAEANVALEDFMQMREVRDAFISILGDALIEGARRTAEKTMEMRAEQA